MSKTRMISLALTLLVLFGSSTFTGSDVQEGDEAALLRAASGGSVDTVRLLLDKGVNAYNRTNVWVYTFKFEQSPPTRTGISQLPFFPTIGVEFEF